MQIQNHTTADKDQPQLRLHVVNAVKWAADYLSTEYKDTTVTITTIVAFSEQYDATVAEIIAGLKTFEIEFGRPMKLVK